MPLDLNLTERDVEQWIYDHPEVLATGTGFHVVHWMGRQYHLPSGIADLIGLLDCGIIMVIEVKNVPINKAALTQVCRYTRDISDIVVDFADYPWAGMEADIMKMVIGTSIDHQTATEAVAMQIVAATFKPVFFLEFSNVVPEDKPDHRQQIYKLSSMPEWNVLGRKIGD